MNFLLSVSFLRQVNNSEPSYWGRADTGRPRPRLAQDIFVYLGSGKIKEEAQREGVWGGQTSTHQSRKVKCGLLALSEKPVV